MSGKCRRIVTYILAAVGLVICFFVYYQNFIAGYFMGMKVVNEKEYKKIVETQTLVQEKPPLTYWNQPVCYDKELDTYYVSQTLSNANWEGELAVPGGQIYILEDPMLETKTDAIKTQKVFKVAAVSETGAAEYKVVFSGMPTIRLDKGEAPENPEEEENYGKITVFDPGAEISKVQTSYATWHPRGNTALRYDKKGYKVNLYNEDWTSEKLSLLGMRNDNDWILNAMYTDSSKVREKLAFDIWRIISESNHEVNEGGSHIEYVEVFVEEEYRGLYGLSEPLDAKQLELDEDDILYKIVNEYYLLSSYELEQLDYGKIDSTELIYPKEMNRTMWKPLSDFLWVFVEEDVWQTGGTTDHYYHTNLSNVADRQIFDQLIYHMDSRFKNEYYVVRTNGDDYEMLLVPWDFNLSFGDCWIDGTVTNAYFSLERSAELFDNPKNNLWKYYDMHHAEEYYDYLQVRWKELQTLGLTEEELIDRASGYMDYLTASGALQRDTVKWPECENSSDLTEIDAYIRMKIPHLTEYIESRGVWPVQQE